MIRDFFETIGSYIGGVIRFIGSIIISLFFTFFNFRAFVLLIPFLVMELLLIGVIQSTHGFALNDHILAIALLNKLVFDTTLYIAGVMLLYEITRTAIIPTLFVSFYILLMATDLLIYYFGNTFLERHHLNLVTWYAIKGFISPVSITFLLLGVGVIILAYKLIREYKDECNWPDLLRYSLIAGMLFYFQVPDYFIKKSEEHTGRFKGNAEKNRHYILRCKNSQVRYASKNSIVNFVEEVILSKTKGQYSIAHSTKPYANTLKKYRISGGKREYRDLNLLPFNKIVLFASESMTLEFISSFNNNISVNTTPYFYNKPEVKDNMFTDYRSTSSPTLQAVTSTFASHPNHKLVLAGHYKNSLPNLLKKFGYKTIFIRSASKYYAKENIIFQHFGFDEIIAREYFEGIDKYKKFIYDWGVLDRIIYKRLINLLNERKDEKLFIVVLGVDTHPPHGRAEYGFKHLKYPEVPDEFSTFKRTSKFMKSVHYHDYDMAYMWEKIKERGLYTEDSLFIVSADHACPYNNVVRRFPNIIKNNVGRIPLAFLTPQQLPPVNHDILSSQLDFAPTILHLLDMPIPIGYWGESLFSEQKKPQSISYERGNILLQTGRRKRRIRDRSKGRYKDFLQYFNTIVYDREYGCEDE